MNENKIEKIIIILSIIPNKTNSNEKNMNYI
jgi:hypothetical protein